MTIPVTAPATNNLADQSTTALVDAFVAKVAIAATYTAQAIIEDPSPPSNQASRIALARLVLSNPLGMAHQSLAWAALADPTETCYLGSSDQEIFNRMAAMWDDLCVNF